MSDKPLPAWMERKLESLTVADFAKWLASKEGQASHAAHAGQAAAIREQAQAAGMTEFEFVAAQKADE